MPLVDEITGLEDLVSAPAGDVESFSDGAASPTTAPPPSPAKLGPYTGPPKTLVAPAMDTDKDPSAEAATPQPQAGYRIGGNVIAGKDADAASAPLRVPRDPNKAAWGWHHVVAFGLLAWGIPFAVSWWLDIDRSIEALLNRSLAVQIVGYLLSALALGWFVSTRQNGDWSTVGLGDDARQGRRDLLRGVGFGLALFLGYLPVGLFTNGRTSLDPMVALFLGNANGTGLVLTCLVVVVGAPLVEEMFFRGVLYEKIARRFPEIAIVVTSVLFMAIHRAIVLQIFLLGLVFAIRRSKGETVWFTTGAHAAWNASVIVVGVVVLTGSAVHFTSTSGSYELRYEKGWERQEEMEVALPMGRIDLALSSANGSAIAAIDIPNVPSLGRAGSARLLKQLPTSAPGASGMVTNIKVEPASLTGASETYDIRATIPIGGVDLNYRMMTARPNGSSSMIVFMVACPAMSCDKAFGDFEDLLATIAFL